jgi:hypothetical protein
MRLGDALYSRRSAARGSETAPRPPVFLAFGTLHVQLTTVIRFGHLPRRLVLARWALRSLRRRGFLHLSRTLCLRLVLSGRLPQESVAGEERGLLQVRGAQRLLRFHVASRTRNRAVFWSEQTEDAKAVEPTPGTAVAETTGAEERKALVVSRNWTFAGAQAEGIAQSKKPPIKKKHLTGGFSFASSCEGRRLGTSEREASAADSTHGP